MAGILGDIGSVLGLVGAGQNAAFDYNMQKRQRNLINKKTGLLGIPEAYKGLGEQLSKMIATMGAGQRAEIHRGFNQSLSSALNKLQQRGLSSSNLTANLTSGNERSKQDALMKLQDQLTGMQTGALQNVGLQGLGTSAGFINQQNAIKGNILGGYNRPQQNVAGGVAGLGSLISGLGSLGGLL